MFDNITQTIDHALVSLLYLASGFILFFIGKLAFQFSNKKINVNHELVEKDNLAFSISFVGYYVGLLMAIGSAMSNELYGTHIWMNILDVFILGFIAIILLNISAVIVDKIMLHKFSVRKEIIDDQNEGTGVIQAANYVAAGLIINGAFTENSDAYYEVVILFVISQLVLVLGMFIYNKMIPYDIHEHIEKDNVAVGVGVAGVMIALANLVAYGASVDTSSWMETLVKILVQVVIGISILPVLRLITDKILLPGQNLTDEIVNQKKPNVGAAIIEAFAYIGSSVMIIWSVS
ncbi:MAG: DUF350 domain-containing protein [Ichthyobacteriaceae bacterium]|nr:DUF350 domain-containing protein [Ichthyobacteriaceae bacterium]